MAVESLINSIGRLRVIEKRLLSADFFARLASSQSYSDALRLLEESGYGAYAGESPGDRSDGKMDERAVERSDSAYIEALIDNELQRTYNEVEELSGNSGAVSVFRMRADITNLKLLLKLRLQKSSEKAELQVGGAYPVSSVRAMVETGDYSQLPKQLSDALELLEVEQYKSCDPQRLSSALDNAYVAYALAWANARGDSFIREYFKTLSDFDNILILVRMKASGATLERYESRLLPSGHISRDSLIRAFDMNEDAVADDIIFNPFEGNDNVRKMRDRLRAAYRACQRGAGASAIERERDASLMELARRGRNDIASIAPIIGYMLAREREAALIRLILTVKRNGLPQSVIDERMVEPNG